MTPEDQDEKNMSSGLRDSFKWLMQDRDSLDGLDDWDIEEITEAAGKPIRPWLDWRDLWSPKEKKCTCGSEKVHGKGGAHSSWCDSK